MSKTDYTKLLLGENSYPVIVGQIVKKIQSAQTSTLEGSNFLNEMYTKLNESKTPILDIKPFVTSGEKVASNDIGLKEVLDFCKKSITKGDLNFLINLAKEEHFKEMGRLYHPKPEATVAEIEESFNEPSSVIEAGIRSGLFDCLKSDLLGMIKKNLGIETTKKLNESVNNVLFKDSLVKYNPIGIEFDDKKHNRKVMLLENHIFEYNKETDSFKPLNESEIVIADSYKVLMNAINNSAYNPETCSFGLNENWDFNMLLKEDGKVMIGDKEIKKDDVSKLLLESINHYSAYPGIVQGFNKQAFLKDADNFIALVENNNLLIKFDQLNVIKNLNENQYIIIDNESVFNAVPEILASSKNQNKKLFESYQQLVEESNNILNNNITDLFESQLRNEQNLLTERNIKIVSLNEEQKELNNVLTNIKNLKSMAETNSPAMQKLNEQENVANERLAKNIDNLNFYMNDYKLY